MKKIIYYYFFITYFVTVMLTNNEGYTEVINRILWIIPFSIWVISFFLNKLDRDSDMLLWSKYTVNITKYFFLLGIVMIITNLVSLNVVYSIFSGVFTVTLFYIMFEVAGTAVININRERRIKKLITNQIILIQVIAIIGELFIPSWNWDSTIRLSGGVNPNMMAFISLFSIIWFLDVFIDKDFILRSVIGMILSTITLLWTLSRGRLLGLFFLGFFFWTSFVLILLNPKLKYKFKKYKGIIFIILLLFLIICLPLVLQGITTNESIMRRLSQPLDTRLSTWNILLDSIRSNVFLGPLGWWNTSNFIEQNLTSNMATSSHNFFIRILSEVGMLGLVTILLLPIILVYKTIKKALVSKTISKKNRFKLLLYSSGISAFFVTQFFEDQYLDGIGDFEMGIFVWLFAFCFYYLNEKKINENDKGEKI